jgi:alpha-beta hydrolase superfamily lysophospholipase
MPAEATFVPLDTAEGCALFVWHHAPPASVRRGGAIVLCPPIGYEYMSAYRSVRILAERLAALGFDTLRIDYEGTGNSTGDDLTGDNARPCRPGIVDAWRRSVVCAIAEARRLAGSDAVAVVGIRAGALVALHAIPDVGTVDRLVLWGAFPSGRAYLRELKAYAGLNQEPHADEDVESGINAAGYILTEETIASIARWTMESVAAAPAEHILLVDRDDRTANLKLAAHLQQVGACVTRIQPRGTAEMLDLPHYAKVPDAALEEIVSWFRPWLAEPSFVARETFVGRPCPSRRAALEAAGYQERLVRFGPGDRLFGALTSPRDQTSKTAPSIVLFNTGFEYHVGPHRLYVPLARYWAARGHHVLRYDLGGIGDSAPPPGAPDNVAYPAHMLDDAREAIAFVQKEAMHGRVIAAGLCSGGWLAFQAARDGLAVEAVVSINPPMYLRDRNAGLQWVADANEFDRYQHSMRNPSKWLKALSGGAAYAHFMRVSASALRRSVAARVGGVLGDVIPEGLARDLRTIADRGTRALFVFSRGDDGLQYFQWHAQAALRRARVREFVQHLIVDGAGHTFRPRAAQQQLREILIDFVDAADRIPDSPTPSSAAAAGPSADVNRPSSGVEPSLF